MCIRTILDVGSECGFNSFIPIFCYLLKFVNGNNARTVGCFEVVENLFKTCFGLLYLSKPDVERWQSADGVDANPGIER